MTKKDDEDETIKLVMLTSLLEQSKNDIVPLDSNTISSKQDVQS